MGAKDELLLDALLEIYGTRHIGEGVRRALHDAAVARGVDVDAVTQEARAAA